jgi:peptidyl-prolyl cis-trans isomerase C
MKNLLLLLTATLAWGQQIIRPPAAATDPVVLTVGTEKLTQAEFERILATLPAQQRAAVDKPGGKHQMAEQLSELLMLAQAAKANKLDQERDVQIRLALVTNQTLANAEYQFLGKPDDAALHAYYDAHKDEMTQVHARHILIRFKGSRVPLRADQKDLTEEEALAKAKEIRAKLVAGAKFADVAKAESDDTGSGDNGGDLDAFTKGSMVPEFEKAAFELPIGQISEPVKSQFGYHLILVESRQPKSFADASEELVEKVASDQAKKGLDDMKKKTNIVYNDAYFGK